MREHLDRVFKADQCAKYVDDIGIGANDADQLITNFRATFECIKEAGLKLTMQKCHFSTTEIDFLGRMVTPEGVKETPKRKESLISWKNNKSPEVQEGIATLCWFP